MSVQVPIEFTAKFDKAVKSIDSFADQAKSKLDIISSSTAFLGITKAAELAVKGFQKIASGLDAVITEAIDAEDSLNRLANALKISGNFTEENIRSFEELADEIQRTTKFDDDLIISQLAVAKRFGATNKEAERLIRAATELSTVTGDDLASSVEILGRSLDGTAGRLAELVPQTAKLTSAQLANNGAAELLIKLYGGSAQSAANTFSGALTKLSNSFNNLLENIGKFITKNETLIKIINALSSGFDFLSKKLSSSFDEDISNKISNINKEIEKQVEINKKLEDQAKRLANNPIFSKTAINNLEIGRAKIDDLRKALNRLTDQQAKSAKGFDDQKNALGRFNKEAQKAQLEFDSKVNEAIAKSEQNRIKFLEEQRRKQLAFLSQAGASLLQGRQGAINLTGAIAEQLGQLGGIPGLGPIAQLLAQGPEQVRMMVREFVDSIPVIVENIADSIPVIIEVLAEKLTDPDFIARLATTFAKAAFRGLTLGFDQWIPKLLSGADVFISRLVEGAGRFVEEIVRKIGEALSFNKPGGVIGGTLPGGGPGGVLGDFLNNIVAPTLGGPIFGGGGSNPIADIGGAIGGVFKAGSAPQVQSNQNRQTPIVIQIGQREMARVLVDLERQGFRTT